MLCQAFFGHSTLSFLHDGRRCVRQAKVNSRLGGGSRGLLIKLVCGSWRSDRWVDADLSKRHDVPLLGLLLEGIRRKGRIERFEDGAINRELQSLWLGFAAGVPIFQDLLGPGRVIQQLSFLELPAPFTTVILDSIFFHAIIIYSL